jgi:flagellar biosynthesis protein FliQ
MTDHTAPLAIALVTGAGAGLMQATAQTSPAISMFVPIISALVGGAISYGILKGVVQTMERDVNEMRRDLGHIYDLIRDASDRVARIEGRLQRDE